VSTPPFPPPPPPSPYTPPAAGGPPPYGGEDRLPWEERDRLGLVEALIQTIRLVVTEPSNAFARLRADSDLTSPILFGLILSWAGVIVSQMWQLMFGGITRGLFEGVEGMEGVFAPPGFLGFLGWVVLWPILFVVFIFIGAGILHLCVLLVGAAGESSMGFEGTLKVVCYSQVASLAGVIPIAGGFLAILWTIVLEVIGLALVHRTTQGRALAAVLIPILVCCGCGLFVAICFGAMIAAMIGSMTGSGVSP
jgi:hypothetical protein